MTFADEVAGESKLRREHNSLLNQNARLETEVVELRKVAGLIDSLAAAPLHPPKWLTPAKPGKHHGTLVLMLSDMHFDEVVLPAEMEGLNAYNRTIATMRLKAWTANVVKMSRHYLAGIHYDGVVILLGGDTFSGDIHEELQQTNEDTILGSLLYWSEQLAAAFTVLADEFGHVHVAAVPGNHGRTSRKPRAKLRARTNFDWLVAKMIERHFTGDRRFTWQIPESSDVMVRIYDHSHLLTHGDQVNGGGGIGGIYPPIMRLRARKAQRHASTGKTFATLWMGHWHQYLATPSLVISGSMKGADEYSLIGNFGFEVPQLALAVVTPEHNITWQAPVFCQDRKTEGW